MGEREELMSGSPKKKPMPHFFAQSRAKRETGPLLDVLLYFVDDGNDGFPVLRPLLLSLPFSPASGGSPSYEKA